MPSYLMFTPAFIIKVDCMLTVGQSWKPIRIWQSICAVQHAIRHTNFKMQVWQQSKNK